MILMGAGTNHWYHSDQIYRAMLVLTSITGCQGRNGGGWAHYVGRRRSARSWASNTWPLPSTGCAAAAHEPDGLLVRQHQSVPLRHLRRRRHQRRHRSLQGSQHDGPARAGRPPGWAPSYPQFNKSSLTVADDAAAAGVAAPAYVAAQLKSGELKFAIEDPEAPENFPRILSLWRANLFGSSAKGNEYFLKHLLGTDNAVKATEAGEEHRPEGIVWPEKAGEGKLDLLLTLDFRMTSSTLFSDVVLPAATWYEKHDINTTDMHPFVHSFNPAIAPPWQSKSDWETGRASPRGSANSPRTASASARTSSPSRSGTTPPEAMATVHGASSTGAG